MTGGLNVVDLHKYVKKYDKFKKKRILVIDDEEFCLTMMQQILFRVGVDVEHRVDFCMSGLEAIKHLEEALDIGV